MKAYMTVKGGVGEVLYPGVDCPPLSQVNSDYVNRDEIGEFVSSISWRAFRKFK